MRRLASRLLARAFRGPWTPLRLTGFVFGFIVVAFAINSGQQVYSYVDQDPNFCRSCHTMEKAWVKWQVSEHSNITCHSCHESNPIDSTEQVIKYAMNRPDQVRKHARVNDETCEKCHAGKNGQWKQIAETAGHKVHVEEQRVACVKCHGVSVHSFQPPAQVCLSCHNNQQVKMTKMAERYCLDCHNYLREDSPLRPTREACLFCHQKQAGRKTNWPADAPMQFLCSQCHQPHKQAAPEVNCQSCHQDIKKTGLHAASTHAKSSCTTCHQPHEWQVTKRDSCTACHQNKVEHNKSITCATCHDFQKPKNQT